MDNYTSCLLESYRNLNSFYYWSKFGALIPAKKNKKMTILKLLLHLVPVKDAGIQKLVMFRGRSTTFTAKKKRIISQLKENKCGVTQPSFWRKLRQIRVCNHSNLLIKWAMWEVRSLWMHHFKSASVPPVHTHFLQYLQHTPNGSSLHKLSLELWGVISQ